MRKEKPNMRRQEPTAAVMLLALRAAWHQSDDKIRREWFAEIVSDVAFPLPKRKRGAANGSQASSSEFDDDAIVRYLAERTIKRSGGRVQAAVLRADYNAWASDNGERQRPGNSFGLALRRLGMRSVKYNTNFYLDIELRKAAPSAR
jgi:hypothetical protein